ncbi:MAG: VOC family protein [Proteobacteria bacterium]|nr:VOC family protein [Burkholderiales bacterium]
MPKLRHIALSVPDPWKAAEFYMQAFGMKKVGETDSTLARGVYLSDGVINMALLNYKTDEAAGEDRGRDFVGLHHLGFWVDDVEETRKRIEAAGGTYWMGEVASMSNIFYEVKFRDPHGMIIDTTAHGWGGASKDGTGQDVKVKLRHEGLVADRAGLAETAEK